MSDFVKKTRWLTALLVLCVCAASQAGTSIAYINANAKNVDYLAGYGYDVTYINYPGALSVAQLSSYEAVLVAPNARFSDPVGLGNTLGGYADAGGGVVMCMFSFLSGWNLQGQIMAPGYSPFSPSGGSWTYTARGLGTIYDASHPIFEGVNTANVPTYWEVDPGLTTGATLLAEWPVTGRDAVAFNTLSGGNSVVGLNLFPATYSTYQAMTPDSQRLVANALGFSIGSGDEAAPTVPVPGAAVLGFLGVGLTGWLRRRCSL